MSAGRSEATQVNSWYFPTSREICRPSNTFRGPGDVTLEISCGLSWLTSSFFFFFQRWLCRSPSLFFCVVLPLSRIPISSSTFLLAYQSFVIVHGPTSPPTWPQFPWADNSSPYLPRGRQRERQSWLIKRPQSDKMPKLSSMRLSPAFPAEQPTALTFLICSVAAIIWRLDTLDWLPQWKNIRLGNKYFWTSKKTKNKTKQKEAGEWRAVDNGAQYIVTEWAFQRDQCN